MTNVLVVRSARRPQEVGLHEAIGRKLLMLRTIHALVDASVKNEDEKKSVIDEKKVVVSSDNIVSLDNPSLAKAEKKQKKRNEKGV